MNDLDKLIRKELEKETTEIDELLAREEGLPDMVAATFKGTMRRWVWFISIVIFMVTGAFIWCGYNFYYAATVDDRVFWGVWFILSVLIQVALKKWHWMEINRISTLREIKRLELAIVAVQRTLKA